MLAKILPRLSDLRPETGAKRPPAAKALGLDVPLSFEQLADEVIE